MLHSAAMEMRNDTTELLEMGHFSAALEMGQSNWLSSSRRADVLSTIFGRAYLSARANARLLSMRPNDSVCR